jgi:hypothetical protein
MNKLAQLLKVKRIGRAANLGPDIESDIAEAEEEEADRFLGELESLLRSFQEDEIEEEHFAQVSLQDPVLLLLAQHRSFRICRRELFCPVEKCRYAKPFTSVGQMANHIQSKHGATKEETADMFRFVISKLLPRRIEMKVTTDEGRTARRKWSFCRCHHPDCGYIKAKAYLVDTHIRDHHKEMKKDMKTLGWFWGTLHTMMKVDPKMTIAEALGEGQFWECKTEKCHQPFHSRKALAHHFVQAHAKDTREGWEALSRRLTQKWAMIDDVRSDEMEAETGQEQKGKEE